MAIVFSQGLDKQQTHTYTYIRTFMSRVFAIGTSYYCQNGWE